MRRYGACIAVCLVLVYPPDARGARSRSRDRESQAGQDALSRRIVDALAAHSFYYGSWGLELQRRASAHSALHAYVLDRGDGDVTVVVDELHAILGCDDGDSCVVTDDFLLSAPTESPSQVYALWKTQVHFSGREIRMRITVEDLRRMEALAIDTTSLDVARDIVRRYILANLDELRALRCEPDTHEPLRVTFSRFGSTRILFVISGAPYLGSILWGEEGDGVPVGWARPVFDSRRAAWLLRAMSRVCEVGETLEVTDGSKDGDERQPQ